jgi:two-component system cell cycle sensor histidine kinase/response regulator CckA
MRSYQQGENRERSTTQRDDGFVELYRLASVGRLAMGMAHDLANLLGAVSVNARRLDRDLTLSERDRGALIDIIEASRRSNDLVQRVMAVGSGWVATTTDVDLADVVENLQRTLAFMVGPSVRLTATWPERRVPVRVDRSAIEQALINLCVNACHAMGGAGGVRVSCQVEAWDGSAVTVGEALAAGRYAVLTVEDEGPGIDPAEIARLFTPFYTTRDGGTGLGLTIVARAVETADGAVVVDASDGGGARFRMLLPLASSDDAAA